MMHYIEYYDLWMLPRGDPFAEMVYIGFFETEEQAQDAGMHNKEYGAWHVQKMKYYFSDELREALL